MSYELTASASYKLKQEETVLVEPLFTIPTIPAVTTESFQYDTQTIAISTTFTVPMGNIVTGKYCWIKVNNPVIVTLTQTTGKELIVEGFYMVQADFTEITIENESDSNTVALEYFIAGDLT